MCSIAVSMSFFIRLSASMSFFIGFSTRDEGSDYGNDTYLLNSSKLRKFIVLEEVLDPNRMSFYFSPKPN